MVVPVVETAVDPREAVAAKRMRIQKVKGAENPADLGTRHLKADDIDKHLHFLKFMFRPGRSNAVPGIAYG